ncbi:ribosomal protein alanine acetyltransferase [Glycocaulis alkaliphilus]|uniref:[Ribosomal protein bS18]-alanine N-acetyltransferase n=1 Tax=Glycocaulis alkaliphilus TaxID=1434191 RepID=A0A3T0E693_9PROT|nr:ribosomal protein S18-alanine N-acetyltransferase [Glycocaulis alkaliphilus]AZU02736.1 ribosomal protein alanine acetyltransferase [Glycocaulis alkaliphilus]GGB79394.1 ribosomal-protein-alanine acetyltransferase [Glycocaulis alkaliphilus]
MSADILAAGPESSELLAALHAKAFDGGEVWDAAAFEALLAGPGMDAVIAREGEAPLGFILMRTIADEAEMLTLAVLPSARRAGAGRALVKAGLEAAQRRGAANAFLEVSVNNAAAIALYRTTGWNEAGHRTRYYRDGSDALVMSRSL